MSRPIGVAVGMERDGNVVDAVLDGYAYRLRMGGRGRSRMLLLSCRMGHRWSSHADLWMRGTRCRQVAARHGG